MSTQVAFAAGDQADPLLRPVAPVFVEAGFAVADDVSFGAMPEAMPPPPSRPSLPPEEPARRGLIARLLGR